MQAMVTQNISLGVALITVLGKVSYARVTMRAGGSVAPIHPDGPERRARALGLVSAALRVTATYVSSWGNFSSTRTAITFALPVTVLRVEKEG